MIKNAFKSGGKYDKVFWGQGSVNWNLRTDNTISDSKKLIYRFNRRLDTTEQITGELQVIAKKKKTKLRDKMTSKDEKKTQKTRHMCLTAWSNWNIMGASTGNNTFPETQNV